jgi:hypothetical protein
MKKSLELKIVPPLAMLISVGFIYAITHLLSGSIVSLTYKAELTGFFIVLGLLFDFSAIAFFSELKQQLTLTSQKRHLHSLKIRETERSEVMIFSPQ